MEFKYTPELEAYIHKHQKTTLLVEMVELNNSDLDISELHPYFVNQRMRDQFVNRKGYRVFTTELGEVLLPNYPFETNGVVTLGLKSFLCFHHVTCQGIKI